MQQVVIHDKKFEPFLTRESIQERIEELAGQIKEDHADRSPVFVVILKGAFHFGSDLFRAYTGNAELSFARYSSYHGTSSTGEIKEVIALDSNLRDRDIILVEDIVDSGLTMSFLLEKSKQIGVRSVSIATLLFKPDACKVALDLKYIGFRVKNDFLVGYGLDYNELGRNLDAIYKLSNE